jgi:hypothetical protein
MTEKEIQFRKRRELGDVLSDSFSFLKQEYKPISSLIITYVLPFLILYGIVNVYVQMKVFVNFDFTDQEELMKNIGPFYANVFLVSLFGVFVQSLLVGTYYSYIEIYVKKGKGNFDLSEIKPLLFSNSLLALGAGIVVYLLVIAGTILCFVPGFYFANTFSLTSIIIIFERKGLGNALSRSRFLVHKQWWNTLLINIIGILIIIAAGFVFSIPGIITGFTTTLTNLNDGGAVEYPNWYWVYTAISTAVSSLLWIVPFTFWAMQYFNLDEQTKPGISIPE